MIIQLEGKFLASSWVVWHVQSPLHPGKFSFGADTVVFAGFEIAPHSVFPAKKYLDAIHNFFTPTTIIDVCYWFGLVSRGKALYAFATTEYMLPFRHLLKPDVSSQWTTALEELFKESKQVIAKEIEEGIAIIDANRLTCLVTDWSKTGIDFWLLQ